MEGQLEGPYGAVFPARRDAFAGLRAFIEDACAKAGVSRHDCLRLTLLLEELFVNTVVHGHKRDSEAPVRLALTIGAPIIGVVYEDTAPAYNPFAAVVAPSESPDPDQRAVGGLGITLITTMAENVAWASPAGANRISFRLRRTG